MASLKTHPLFKRMLHLLLGDYQYWKVYAIDLPQPQVMLPAGVTVRALGPAAEYDCADEELLSRMDSGGQEALGYGLFVGKELVAVQWYWWGARYEDERKGRSWRLPPGTAKSTGLYTVPRCRGKGYAAVLKQQSAFLMSERGFTRLYSRIWHSHTSSIRVSEKAGWRKVGSYIEVCPFAKLIQLRIPR